MDTKYQIKEKQEAKWELKHWEDMRLLYLERVNFDNYTLVNWDEIAKNAGHISIKDQINIFCVKQSYSRCYPVGSLVVRHKPQNFDSTLIKITVDVDLYAVKP